MHRSKAKPALSCRGRDSNQKSSLELHMLPDVSEQGNISEAVSTSTSTCHVHVSLDHSDDHAHSNTGATNRDHIQSSL